MNAPDISQDEADFIRSYAAEVTAVFGKEFKDNRSRFKGSEKLLARFADAVASMLSNSRHLIARVDEAHNELCVGSQLLANRVPRFVSLEYEPALPRSAKSIDFRARTDDGQIFYVDVKTIRPRANDRWDQFEKAREGDWFPENVRLTLSEHGLGGELWHNMFAARSRMLEYALQLEAKIGNCALGETKENFFILVFGGEGFTGAKMNLKTSCPSIEQERIDPMIRSPKPKPNTSLTRTSGSTERSPASRAWPVPSSKSGNAT